MRPQARAFSVEIKSRKRPTSPAIAASAASPDDWVDLIPPDDVPERDVHEDLADASVQSEARREAERLFGRLGDGQPVETRKDATGPFRPEPDAPAPARVLPDLLAEIREQERQNVVKPERKRAAKATGAKRPRKTDDAQLRLEPPQPVTPQQTSPSPVLTARAQAALSTGRRIREAGKRLPRGQRWKERRLPRVCWDR
jgi:hypothetical protein